MKENDINPINLEDWEIAELAESKMQKILGGMRPP